MRIPLTRYADTSRGEQLPFPVLLSVVKDKPAVLKEGPEDAERMRQCLPTHDHTPIRFSLPGQGKGWQHREDIS